MRTFGKDTPDFFIFKIAGRKKTYKLPTLASLPYEYNIKLARIGSLSDQGEANAAALEFQMEILERYIGEDAKDFPTDAVSDLFTEWFAYSAETTGVDEGEYSGSSE